MYNIIFGQGVYIAPTLPNPLGPAPTQILDNFRAAAQIIHRYMMFSKI